MLGLLAGLLLAASPGVRAQDNAPVRLLVGFPAGGSTDALARVLADKLRGPLGRPVIVENKPGVAGRMATLAVKAASLAEPVFMIAPNAIVSQMLLYTPAELRYDMFADLQPVAVLVSFPQGMVVHPSTGVKNARELAEWMRKSPDRAFIGNGGLGSESHFYALEFGKAVGVATSVVPYRGNGPLMTDLIGGQVGVGIAAASDIIGPMRDGRVRAIGVFSARRSPLLPDVPTMVEQGIKLEGPEPWSGMWASARMPKPEVERMQAALRQVLAMPDVREVLVQRYSFNPDFRPAAEMDRMQHADMAYWGPVIKASGFKPTE